MLQVVSAYQFELHSGSTKKHPSDYIYFDNGKNIRDVLRVCTTAPLDMFESIIQSAISSVTHNKVSICQGCNGRLIKYSFDLRFCNTHFNQIVQ